jgi:predicted RNase H-like nuclease (RuvC/YqgF family)
MHDDDRQDDEETPLHRRVNFQFHPLSGVNLMGIIGLIFTTVVSANHTTDEMRAQLVSLTSEINHRFDEISNEISEIRVHTEELREHNRRLDIDDDRLNNLEKNIADIKGFIQKLETEVSLIAKKKNLDDLGNGN